MTSAQARALSADRVQAMQEKAVRFQRDVVGNDDPADEIEGLSVAEYADRKKISVENPGTKGGERSMETVKHLTQRIRELEERNAELEEALSLIGESVDSALPEDDDDDD